MNILYIHGFESRFNINNHKVITLNSIGDVYGIDIDYTNSYNDVKRKIESKIKNLNIDLVVGTSLGAYYAMQVGSSMNIPFISINVTINPKIRLMPFEGENIAINGDYYFLSKYVIESYEDLKLSGDGLVLLDNGDDLLNSYDTKNYLQDHYIVKTFEGGNHMFAHIEESINMIENFYYDINVKSKTCAWCVGMSAAGFFDDGIPKCNKANMKELPYKEEINSSNGLSNVTNHVKIPIWCPLDGIPLTAIKNLENSLK